MSFDNFSILLDDNPFDEIPVDAKTFVEDKRYLGLPALGEIQYIIVESMAQIYKQEDVERIMGATEGARYYKKYTKNELILALGKGCHSPDTDVFDPQSGKWVPLSITKEGCAATMAGNQYATEPFYEGFGEMVKVKTSLGFEEKVYVKHKYLWMSKNGFYNRLRDNAEGEFKEIDSIVVGDRVAIGLKMEPSNPKNIPKEHAELIGYWLGDGMLPADHNKIINMDFSIDEVESIARYLELCDFIGDAPTKTTHRTKKMVSFRHGRNSNAVLLAAQYGLWGMRSKTKRIPDEVWGSDNEVLAKTIEKLWQTDGTIYKKNGLTAEFVSVSEQLANDVQKGLLRLGIPGSIRSRLPKSNFGNASKAYYVSVSSQERFNAFAEKIALLDHKRTSPLKKNGRVYHRLKDNVYWDKVVSIEPVGMGEYWTRTVPDVEHYIGNGIISANSGKDFASTVGVAYVVYKLLCLKDPANYYGKPPGDAIDIINIAINAQQARNVFFKGLKNKIERSPWFAGKYYAKMDSIEFKKSITVYSGHSERESHEGLNLFIAILDEISGFGENAQNAELGKTADNIYKAFRGTVDSRFPDYGKVVLLSFTRYEGDYISRKYNDAIAEKEVVERSHTFVINPDLPADYEDNTLKLEWEEDHITKYKLPKVLALRRPTWDVNPTRTIEDFKIAFYTDPIDAKTRFLCSPSVASDAFFRNKDKIQGAMTFRNPVDSSRRIDEQWIPDPDTVYYLHADLAQKVDKCAVAVAHVEKWVSIQVMGEYRQIVPIVVVDMIAWWEPRKEGPVDLSDVKKWIQGLRRMGTNIGIVTFDRWNSLDIQNELREGGIRSETLSVAKKHYEDLAMLIYEDRIALPSIDLLLTEMTELKVINDKKVDHPRKGAKDLSDAMCGAVYNAISRTPRNIDPEIEVHTWAQSTDDKETIIESSPPEIPEEAKEYLFNFGLL